MVRGGGPELRSQDSDFVDQLPDDLGARCLLSAEAVGPHGAAADDVPRITGGPARHRAAGGWPVVLIRPVVDETDVMRLDEWAAHPMFGSGEPADPERWLFHYTSLASAAAIALTGDMLLSPLAVLNDPQEAAARPIMTITAGDLANRPRSVTDDERAAFEQTLEQLRGTIRVGCFTRDAAIGSPSTAARFDGRGYARPRTWAQYGDGHTGACLVLDRQRLEVEAERLFGGRRRCEPVGYAAGFDDVLHLAETVAFDRPDPDRHFRERVIGSLLRKNADWQGEREYRIVVWGHHDVVCALPVADAVVGLVLGVRFPAHQMPIARKIAERFDVVEDCALLMMNNAVLDPHPLAGPDGKWHRWHDQDLRERGRVFDL